MAKTPIMKFTITIFFFFLIISCNNLEKSPLFYAESELIDTSIVIHNIPNIKIKYDFSENEAKDFLYLHYKKQGVKNESELKLNPKSYNDELIIAYDTIYKLESEKSIAVIQYWKAPASASGEVILPHHAIISKNQKGLNITNKDFIPLNFFIDSVRVDTIYVSDVKHFKRKYRIKLK